jgi:pimeloyl-ACP methyl ester carboxylesterase
VRHLAGYSREHQFTLLEGQGHLPMRSAPQQLAQVISTWLSELG